MSYQLFGICLICFVNLQHLECGFENTIPWETYYWELKPYIYRGPDGVLTGMIVDYYEEQRRAGIACFQNTSKKLVTFTHPYESRRALQQLENNTSIKGYVLPILGDPHMASSYSPLHAYSVALVGRRSIIELSSKIMSSILDSVLLTLLVLMTISLFSVIHLVLENMGKKKEAFCFASEFWFSIWFAVVTMTTVGYGDRVPLRIPTRFITVPMMVAGLVVSSLITGSITNFVYTGHDYRPPYKDKAVTIGVLHNSEEQKITKRDLMADDIQGYKTYEDLLQAVRRNEITYAVINSDIVAYAQDSWNDGYQPSEMLVSILTVPTVIPINIGWVQDSYEMSDKFAVCVDYYDKAARLYTYARHRKKVKVTGVYIPPLQEFLIHYPMPLSLLIIASSLLFLGVSYDLITYSTSRYSQQRQHKPIDSAPVKMNNRHSTNDVVDIPKNQLIMLRNELEDLHRIVHEIVKDKTDQLYDQRNALTDENVAGNINEFIGEAYVIKNLATL